MRAAWRAAVEEARTAVAQDSTGHLELAPRRALHEAMGALLGDAVRDEFTRAVGLRALDDALQSPAVLTDDEPRRDVLLALRVLLRVADRRMAASTAEAHANEIQARSFDWIRRGDAQQFAMRVAYRTLSSLKYGGGPAEERATDRASDPEAWDLSFCASVVFAGGLPWTAVTTAAVEARRAWWGTYLALASEAETLDWVALARAAAARYGLDADRSNYRGGARFDTQGNEQLVVFDAEGTGELCHVAVCRAEQGVVLLEIEGLTRALPERELTRALREAMLEDFLREEFEEPYAAIRVTNRDDGTTWELPREEC